MSVEPETYARSKVCERASKEGRHLLLSQLLDCLTVSCSRGFHQSRMWDAARHFAAFTKLFMSSVVHSEGFLDEDMGDFVKEAEVLESNARKCAYSTSYADSRRVGGWVRVKSCANVFFLLR